MATPQLSYLVEDLVGEILLRLPPAEPADLLHASLVCKRWRRLLTDPAFRRRYCEFHRTPPLLGFFLDDSGPAPGFVPAVASPCSPPALECNSSSWVLDCRHGRVLILSFKPCDLVVWDPITRGRQRVPRPSFDFFTGAVLCAVDGCDHLNCHGGPFRVVFVGTNSEGDGVTRVSIYSSETGAWGASNTIVLEYDVEQWPSLLVGDVLYFTVIVSRSSVLRYDLARNHLSEIGLPVEEYDEMSTVVIVEDGRLGLAGVYNWSLYLWSWQETGAQGTAGWKQCRVIDLGTLLPIPETSSLLLSGFMEGTDSIFLSTDVGVFRLQLKSREVTKISDKETHPTIIPYTGFYTP